MLNWFNRVRQKHGPNAAREAERINREAAELHDPYDDRTLLRVGDRVAVDPQQILHNIYVRMERIDLDPDTDWAPEEIMSLDEAQLMVEQFGFGEMVVAVTADYARQILTRWPAELVGHPYPDEARIEMFLHGYTIDHDIQDIGKRVINRALSSEEEVESHPELDGLDTDRLVQVWLAVVIWFGIKSRYLHAWNRGELAN